MRRGTLPDHSKGANRILSQGIFRFRHVCANKDKVSSNWCYGFRSPKIQSRLSQSEISELESLVTQIAGAVHSSRLLTNILPRETADELKIEGKVQRITHS